MNVRINQVTRIPDLESDYSSMESFYHGHFCQNCPLDRRKTVLVADVLQGHAGLQRQRRRSNGGCISSDGSGSVSPARWSASATTKEGVARAIVSNWDVEGQIDRPQRQTDTGRLPPRTRQFLPSCFSAERCMMEADGQTEQTIRMT